MLQMKQSVYCVDICVSEIRIITERNDLSHLTQIFGILVHLDSINTVLNSKVSSKVRVRSKLTKFTHRRKQVSN